MATHIRIIGILLIVLAFIHVFFPRHFRWKKELNSLTLINRQMMYVHTFFIALTVFLMGLFCLLEADEMILNNLGRKISLGFGLFWGVRLLVQFIGYSTTLWKGKKRETAIHILFILLWSYFSAVFLLTAFM